MMVIYFSMHVCTLDPNKYSARTFTPNSPSNNRGSVRYLIELVLELFSSYRRRRGVVVATQAHTLMVVGSSHTRGIYLYVFRFL